MVWQEFVFLIGGFVLGLALLPSVFSPAKPAWTTSALTGGVLALFALTFLTLGQYLSAVGIAFNTGLWFVLLAQARFGRNLEVVEGA